jgi:transcriptional regulator with XRE-family HTH domain
MKPLAPELEAKIDEINGWMLSGDQEEVARRARVDSSWVSKVLNKKMTPTKKVLDAAIEVMEENKTRFQIKPQSNLRIA